MHMAVVRALELYFIQLVSVLSYAYLTSRIALLIVHGWTGMQLGIQKTAIAVFARESD